MNFDQAKEKLHRAGQEHVLAYYEELTKEQKELLRKLETGGDDSQPKKKGFFEKLKEDME